MKLTTQCPRCKSRFAASVADLQRRKGFIRCVNCANIFDGFEEVVSDDEQLFAEPLPPVNNTEDNALAVPDVAEPDSDTTPYIGQDNESSSMPEPDEPQFYTDVPSVVRADEPLIMLRPSSDNAPQVIRSDRRHFIASNDEVAPAFNIVAHDAKTPHQSLPSSSEPALSARRYSAVLESIAVDDAEPRLSLAQNKSVLSDDGFYVSDSFSAEAFEPEPVSAHTSTLYVDPALKHEVDNRYYQGDSASLSQRAARLFWIAVFVLLAVTLVLQLLYVFRNQVANNLPFTRPAVELLCKQLGCEVAYERRIARIQIVSSSLQLQAGSGAAQDLYTLRIRLRNDYKRKQEWPTLIVTFSDISTAVISRLEIPPQRYLQPQQLQNAFGAFDEIEFTLPVNSRGKRINGYKIDKYFS